VKQSNVSFEEAVNEQKSFAKERLRGEKNKVLKRFEEAPHMRDVFERTLPKAGDHILYLEDLSESDLPLFYTYLQYAGTDLEKIKYIDFPDNPEPNVVQQFIDIFLRLEGVNLFITDFNKLTAYPEEILSKCYDLKIMNPITGEQCSELSDHFSEAMAQKLENLSLNLKDKGTISWEWLDKFKNIHGLNLTGDGSQKLSRADLKNIFFNHPNLGAIKLENFQISFEDLSAAFDGDKKSIIEQLKISMTQLSETQMEAIFQKMGNSLPNLKKVELQKNEKQTDDSMRKQFFKFFDRNKVELTIYG
jgi:hypothetical protein